MIPPASDPHWRNVVTGSISFQPSMLALQILLTRLKTAVERDQSPGNVSRAIGELRAYFEKYEAIAADDLAQIFG
jgi:hypothetical protein